MSFQKIIPLFVIAAMAAACNPLPPRVDNQVAVEPDSVSLRLAEAVDRASTALATLAATEQKREPTVTIDPVPKAPVQLMRSISLEWTGPIEPVARQLADRASYRFLVQGEAPPVPVVVDVVAVNKPVIEVLRDIGLQAGQRATVIVDSNQQLIEINYASQHDG
tara:strand:- start:4111 stop:4602 length:492 start_codon:yes stop_codon:yes gene_type:complete